MCVGVVWFGVVWCGLVWFVVVWFGLPCSLGSLLLVRPYVRLVVLVLGCFVGVVVSVVVVVVRVSFVLAGLVCLMCVPVFAVAGLSRW